MSKFAAMSTVAAGFVKSAPANMHEGLRRVARWAPSLTVTLMMRSAVEGSVVLNSIWCNAV